jgi:two-component system, chemotaxis family, CheB/CheR fusion protein
MSAALDAQFENLLEFLRQQRGFDFTGYKRPSLTRRVNRRMQSLGLGRYDDYREYLEVHPEEFAQLFNTILINVTSFFRDAEAWDYVAREVVPTILLAKRPGDAVRVWSAGCASGEEAYTIAMVLAEAMGENLFRNQAKIYATDMDEEALGAARAALYGAKELQSLDPALRERYFEPLNGRWRFRNDLRRTLIFGRHDLVQDAPISRLDLLVCRNAMMYFNAEAQARILSRFHFALNGDGNGNGYLFLGRAEMLLTHSALFKPLELKYRVFAKIPPPGMARRMQSAAGEDAMAEVTRNGRLMQLALDEAPLPRIVIDANGTLAFANQRARVLFSLNAKDVGRPLQDLEISYRPVELRSLIEQAHAERRAVTLNSVERRFPNGEVQYLDVVVTPLYDERQNPLGTGVAFLDVTRLQKLQQELHASQQEIQTVHEELQSSNEELETTNEELQSSNEELETTNEELQSTNEELETMNEELQSTNEELQTVNEELRTRTEELNHTNAFLQAVFASLRSAAIVVSQNLDVLVWNKRAEDLWGLRYDEVYGKSLLNLDIGLPVAELRGVIRPCLSGDSDHEEVLLKAVNRRGKPIQCRVSCAPLVNATGKRDGVILMMDEAESADRT